MNVRKAINTAALTAVVLALALAESAMAQTNVATERTIRVQGTGEFRVQPDLATIQFAVETTGATAEEATETNAERMDAVIRALIGEGIPREEIRTSGFSLFPVYSNQPRDQQGEPPAILGYRASNQVSVRSRDIEGLGELIDAGIRAGANRLHGVFFEVENSAAAEAEALRRAVDRARASAETMAAALGVRLGPVLDANTTADTIRPIFRARDAQFEMAAVAMPTPIEPGEQTITAMATLVFAIE